MGSKTVISKSTAKDLPETQKISLKRLTRERSNNEKPTDGKMAWHRRHASREPAWRRRHAGLAPAATRPGAGGTPAWRRRHPGLAPAARGTRAGLAPAAPRPGAGGTRDAGWAGAGGTQDAGWPGAGGTPAWRRSTSLVLVSVPSCSVRSHLGLLRSIFVSLVRSRLF